MSCLHHPLRCPWYVLFAPGTEIRDPTGDTRSPPRVAQHEVNAPRSVCWETSSSGHCRQWLDNANFDGKWCETLDPQIWDFGWLRAISSHQFISLLWLLPRSPQSTDMNDMQHVTFRNSCSRLFPMFQYQFIIIYHNLSSNINMGVSENSVPLNPMVNDHYPY